MAPLTEGPRMAAFMVSEANGYRSRETRTVTVPANTTFEPGTVLGRITATGKFVRHDSDGTDDGTREEAGILFAQVVNSTDSAIDIEAVVIERDAEVHGAALIYEDGANDAAKLASNAALAALGIIVR